HLVASGLVPLRATWAQLARLDTVLPREGRAGVTAQIDHRRHHVSDYLMRGGSCHPQCIAFSPHTENPCITTTVNRSERSVWRSTASASRQRACPAWREPWTGAWARIAWASVQPLRLRCR